MNFKLVFKVVGRVMLIVALFMVIPLGVALGYRENPAPFLLSIAIVAGLGGLLSAVPAPSRRFYEREGFFVVGMIWILMGIVGALPFFFSQHGEFVSYVNCVFEAASGFTTTGATILTEIESHARGILFWRSLTHWLGGMGVLVLTTALIPSLGISSRYLAQAESPGPVFSKLVPKQAQTSKILYGIYCALTLLETLALRIAGMPWYDSFIHAMSTAGTGGFSSRNESVGAYGSPAFEWIIAIFILFFSVNFTIHFLILSGKAREAWESDELRFFLKVVAGATLVITVNLLGFYGNVMDSLRYAFFQVSSIISTTGFSSTDYSYWPQFTQAVIICLTFCGACAGSTGGGVKCSRMLLGWRGIKREVRKIIHPRSVEVVKLDGKVVEESTLHSVLVFLVCYIFLTGAVTLLVSLDNFSFATSFTAALTCISNVGPGMEVVGPAGNFAAFSDLSKVALSLLMIVGRLEIFPVLVLFSRTAWRKN